MTKTNFTKKLQNWEGSTIHLLVVKHWSRGQSFGGDPGGRAPVSSYVYAILRNKVSILSPLFSFSEDFFSSILNFFCHPYFFFLGAALPCSRGFRSPDNVFGCYTAGSLNLQGRLTTVKTVKDICLHRCWTAHHIAIQTTGRESYPMIF